MRLHVVLAISLWLALSLAVGIPLGRLSETYAGFCLIVSAPFNMLVHLFSLRKYGNGKLLNKSLFIFLWQFILVLGDGIFQNDFSIFDPPLFKFLLINIALSVAILIFVDAVLRGRFRNPDSND